MAVSLMASMGTTVRWVVACCADEEDDDMERKSGRVGRKDDEGAEERNRMYGTIVQSYISGELDAPYSRKFKSNLMLHMHVRACGASSSPDFP
jgi:hypothetical protein